MKLNIILFILGGIVLGVFSVNSLAGFPQTPASEPASVVNATATPEIKRLPPTRLIITSLGIDTQVEHVGKDARGAMDVPKNEWNVGWYKLGAMPGEMGSAVLDGHLDTATGPAIFAHLARLQIGDEIRVIDGEGGEKIFHVFQKQTFSDATFPIEEVFGKKDGRYLNLITCSGVFNHVTKNYVDRLVIFSRLD
ncbi:class F sortase [Candidatus Roizmanbacteria bacterium]|nr:class F sortase [Candidatus Roizmanbacteria bacterium]